MIRLWSAYGHPGNGQAHLLASRLAGSSALFDRLFEQLADNVAVLVRWPHEATQINGPRPSPVRAIVLPDPIPRPHRGNCELLGKASLPKIFELRGKSCDS